MCVCVCAREREGIYWVYLVRATFNAPTCLRSGMLLQGIQFLETEKLVSSPATSHSVALFLRRTPGLSLTAVGEYLGDHKDFNVDVLNEFAKTFISDFRRLGIEVALRMFLMHFRLPGEPSCYTVFFF